MKIDPGLERKLTDASLRWPKDKPGLEDEMQRIAKDHEEAAIAWRRTAPVVFFLVAVIVYLALVASGVL